MPVTTSALKTAIHTNVLFKPIEVESGPARATPIGRVKRVPMPSKADTRESDSFGTSRCKAELQIAPHKSKLTPKAKAKIAMTKTELLNASASKYPQIA